MKTYARMVNGQVVEIIPPAVADDDIFRPGEPLEDGSEGALVLVFSKGQEIPIQERFTPDIVAQLVEYDPENPPPPPAAPPGPTHAELVDIARVATRAQRQPIMSVLDGLQISAVTLGDSARALVIEEAKDGLRALTELDLSACATYEDMRLAVKARYLEIAAAVPLDVKKAFSEALK